MGTHINIMLKILCTNFPAFSDIHISCVVVLPVVSSLNRRKQYRNSEMRRDMKIVQVLVYERSQETVASSWQSFRPIHARCQSRVAWTRAQANGAAASWRDGANY